MRCIWCGVPRDADIQCLLAAAQLRLLQLPRIYWQRTQITLSLWLTSWCRDNRDNMGCRTDRLLSESCQVSREGEMEMEVIRRKWKGTERLFICHPYRVQIPSRSESSRRDFHSPDPPNQKGESKKKSDNTTTKNNRLFKIRGISIPTPRKSRNSCKTKPFFCHGT